MQCSVFGSDAGRRRGERFTCFASVVGPGWPAQADDRAARRLHLTQYRAGDESFWQLTTRPPQGFDSTVDLFGEHSVQAVAWTLEAAFVLTLAALLVLLSVRVAQQSAVRPLLANRPARSSRIAPPGRDADDDPSARWLSTSLPSRAPPPPDPVQRFCPAPSGERFSG